MATRTNPNAKTLTGINDLEYFKYLCQKVVNVVDDENHRSYWDLAKVLYNKDYFWSVPNDDNRAKDGVALRETFSMGGYRKDPLAGRPCNLLEMMIGLAIRMEDNLWIADYGDRTNHWFFVLVRNIGLMGYTDGQRGMTEKQADDILERLLRRQYEPNGKGGLFPLERPSKDQRNVEIWYQLMEYIDKNYHII